VRSAAAYWTSQGSRVAWYLSQYALAAKLTPPATPRRPAAAQAGPAPVRLPSLGDLLGELRQLLAEDWRNLRAGVYRMAGEDGGAIRHLTHALGYFRDLPAVNARRGRNDFDEVARTGGEALRGVPDYYRRNFHFQTGGYLSEESARLYDHQVEVLFFGGADAMRRQGLVPIAAWLHRNRNPAPRLLDVGCGTGRFLAAIRTSFGSVATAGLDLSPFYLAEARRALRRWPDTALVRGQAETLPAADGSVDLITSVYLLHEVPDAVRARIVAEFARVLRPGGRAVVVDSLQFGDREDYDGLLQRFPAAFHEPFYHGYAGCDLGALATGAGLVPRTPRLAFLSKVMVFDKP
jgi:ubiquinone/menaquinone biosynthesis C-methylase UbiE